MEKRKLHQSLLKASTLAFRIYSCGYTSQDPRSCLRLLTYFQPSGMLLTYSAQLEARNDIQRSISQHATVQHVSTRYAILYYVELRNLHIWLIKVFHTGKNVHSRGKTRP